MTVKVDKRPNMGRRGPFQTPPGFPNGGGRDPSVVGGRGAAPLPGAGGTPQPTLPDESGQAPGNPPPGGFPPAGGAVSNDMPWLDAWEGPFAAPMSPWESQGLEGLSDFAGNDFGLGEAEDYLGRVFGGDYLSGNDPNFQAIEDSGRVLQGMQDDEALRELRSRAAAGGGALSGALLEQEGDYLRGSNAAFNNMMAQLRAANYGRERGFQQDAVRGALGLSDQRLGGYGALMGAGAVPRDIADREIAGQYGDFLRQGRDFREAYRYPDELALATARTGYPGSHPVLFGDSDAEQLSALLAQLFGGGGLAGGIGDFFGGLLGGGEEQPAADGVAAYDGEAGPSSYRDSDYYNAALTEAQRKSRENPPGKASGAGKAMMIMALLAQVLGIGKQGQQGGRKGSGSSGGSLGKDLGDAARKGLDSLFNKNPYKNDPKLQAAWAKHFDKSGKPKEKATPLGYENDLSDITKLQESGLEGDSTDWMGESDYTGDDIDSSLFGSGGIDEVWNDVFNSDDWDTMGGGNFEPQGDFGSDPGGFDLGPGDFTLDPSGGGNIFDVGGGGDWETVDNSGWDDGGISWGD